MANLKTLPNPPAPRGLLTGKTALITAAAGTGIGFSAAKRFLQEGADVFISDIHEGRLAKAVDALEAETGKRPGSGLCNVTVQEEVDALFVQAADHFGPVTVLVNNAGISSFSDFQDLAKRELVNLMDINLLSPMLFTHEFLKRLSPSKSTNTNKVKATIVNVGSAFGSIGYPGFSAYCASKFGLYGFTESLSRELADSNIRVAYFAPRATHTNINSDIVDEMNRSLGNASDSPEFVAKEFMTLIRSNKARKFVGWPEKFFARFNGVFPEIVDRAISTKLNKIKRFLNKSRTSESVSEISLVEEK